MVDDSEDGRLMFEIEKGRFCFRLTEPYSKERRSSASEFAKKQKHKLRNRNSKNKMASVLASNGFVYSNPLAKTFNAVSSVLASTEFVATKRLVSTLVSTSTESVRTNSLVRESSLKPLKKNLKQRKDYFYENV